MSIILNKRYRFSGMSYLYLILRLLASIVLFVGILILWYGVDSLLIFVFPFAFAFLGWLVILGVVYAGKYFKVYEDRLVLYSGFSKKDAKTIAFSEIKGMKIISQASMKFFHVSLLKIWIDSYDETLFLSPQQAEELEKFILERKNILRAN